MRVKLEDLYEGPRYEKRAKNRRYNKLLNICIVLVISLIFFFTYKLIFGGNDETEMTATEESQVSNEETGVAGETDLEEESSTESTESSKTTDKTETTETSETTDAASEEIEETEDTKTVVENSEDPNVLQTIINSSWQPVSTQQVEPHVANYDSASVDWQEMLRALEQATNLTQSEWTLWRLGNDGNEHKAKAVISSKNQGEVYQVYIEWVTNEGWKPVKLEILHDVPAELKG